MIQPAIETQERARFDRSHFDSYGDSELNIALVLRGSLGLGGHNECLRCVE